MELMDISYEMLASSSVLTIYNGKYMLSNGILLDSFTETNKNVNYDIREYYGDVR